MKHFRYILSFVLAAMMLVSASTVLAAASTDELSMSL